MLYMSSQEPSPNHVQADGRPLRVGIVCPYSFETPGGVQNHIRDFSDTMLYMSSQEPSPNHVQADGRPLRVGIVCPYSFETPGGVQNHIRDFSEALMRRGHSVSVFAPGRRTKDMPLWVHTNGSSFAIPYNGSWAHLSYFLALMRRGHSVSVFAPGRRTKDMPLWVHTNGSSFAIPYNGSWAHLSYFLAAGLQTRRWVRQGQFDIVHLHEPEAPSVSHKPLVMHDAPPMVATFHASIEPYPRSLHSWVRQGQFDIVHLHEPEAPSVSHKPLVMHDAPPMVATFHASIEPYPRALHIFERYLRSYLTPLSRAIFVSPAAGRTADHYLPEDIGRTVIPNGIDRSAYLRATPNAQWQGTAEHPTIGFLGRLEEERKAGHAQRAMAGHCGTPHDRVPRAT